MAESPILGLLRSAINPNPPADTQCKIFDTERAKKEFLYCALICNNSGCPHEVGPSQPGVCDCCARKGVSGLSALMGCPVTLKEEAGGKG